MYCRNCGKKIEDDVSFCPECGMKIKEVQFKNNKENLIEQIVKKKVVILFIIFICILAGIAVLFKVAKDKKYEDNRKIVETKEVTKESVEKFDTEKEKQEKTNTVLENLPKTPTGFFTEYAIENAKDNYFVVSKFDGALYGLLDSYGNEVIPLEYDEIIFPESKMAQSVIVKAEGKMGIIDYKGNDVLPLEYSNISNYGDASKFYLVEKDGKQSIVQLDGKIYKKLSGRYGCLIGDSILSTSLSAAEGGIVTDAYSLDEQLLFAEKAPSEQRSTGIFESARYTGAKGYIEINRNNGDTYSIDLMDAQGNIVLSFEGAGINNPGYHTQINDLGTDNLFRIMYFQERLSISENEQYKLINLSKREIGEKCYDSIYQCGESVLAISKDAGQVVSIDIYSLEGQLENTINLNSESVTTGDGLIAAKYGGTYKIYDYTGREISDERYLSIDPEKGFLVIQNLNGEYGLMAPDGTMCIDFGNIGEESYNGLPWKQTYVFGDTFCIVTENSKGNNVWFF